MGVYRITVEALDSKYDVVETLTLHRVLGELKIKFTEESGIDFSTKKPRLVGSKFVEIKLDDGELFAVDDQLYRYERSTK